MNNDNALKDYGISYADIINRLKLSRSYIVHNITNRVKHLEDNSSKGTGVLFDPNELRLHLLSEATFTRRTKLINVDWEIGQYIKLNPNCNLNFTEEDFIGDISNLKSNKRSELPEISVDPFDFWDMSLVFPKEYPKGGEICYRDMFAIGAVKIKLGPQKTMFCLKNDERGVNYPNITDYNNIKALCNNSNYLLVPADWCPFYRKTRVIERKDEKLLLDKNRKKFLEFLKYLQKDGMNIKEIYQFLKIETNKIETFIKNNKKSKVYSR